MSNQPHKCSPCGQVFNTEEEYLNHECPKAAGSKPGTPEYLTKTTTPNFSQISQAAQDRGSAK